jgi:glutamyl-Q tRNA(Asp) synthetase
MTLSSPESVGAPTVGRFAPSPTGPLHFGSLVAAVGSYCLARQAGGRWLLRIEDLDPPRIVPGSADAILRSLEAFGFEWDGPVLYQSTRNELYAAALDHLRQRGLVFDCGCSRQEILASAPHPGEEGPRYPGTCRSGLPPGRHPRAQRLRVPEGLLGFDDGLLGRQVQHLADAVGDFVLRRADGLYSYQLAVVVDDHDTGVNQVVRGTDLIGSTVRQIYLHSCLDQPSPRYLHLPLALGPDGEKLSKRHGAHGLEEGEGSVVPLLRALRFLGQEIPAGLAQATPREILAAATVGFNLQNVPRGAVPVVVGDTVQPK